MNAVARVRCRELPCAKGPSANKRIEQQDGSIHGVVAGEACPGDSRRYSPGRQCRSRCLAHPSGDWGDVVEETEDVGRSQLNAVAGDPRLMLLHLLQLRRWPDRLAAGRWPSAAVSFRAVEARFGAR